MCRCPLEEMDDEDEDDENGLLGCVQLAAGIIMGCLLVIIAVAFVLGIKP